MASDEQRAERAAPRGERTVHCADALAWLEARGVLERCSLITSMPDVSEME